MRNLKFYFILLSILAVANPIRAVQYNTAQSKVFQIFFGAGKEKVPTSTSVQYKPAKNAYPMASKAASSAPQSTTETIVPMASSSTLFRHTAASTTRTASNSTSVSRASSASSATSVLGTLSAERAKKSATTKGANLSGGISASGLMSSGSKYASPKTDNNSVTTAIANNGPAKAKRGFIDDDPDPFPDTPVPLGDVAIPLLLIACMYIIFIHIRKFKKT